MIAKNEFPEGWDEDRVRRALEHYEGQTEDEAVAEDESAYENQSHSIVEVPVELLPEVRAMIARHKKSA